MRRSIIVAMAANRVIGRDGGLPWHLPTDLRHFRKITMGHHLIMGRKTFESIGRPLPGRTSIVLTQNPQFRPPNVLIAHTLEDAWSLCSEDDEVFVIGGTLIFQIALPHCQRMYLTRILMPVEGTTYFPEFSADWKLVESVEPLEKNPNELPMRFEIYEQSPVRQ